MLQRLDTTDAALLEELEELEIELFEDTCLNRRSIAREVDAGRGFVSYGPAGEVQGYAILRVCQEDALIDILRLAVSPQYQGRRVGTRMMEELVASRGGYDMMLTVRKSNAPALTLYKRNRFRVVGETGQSWMMYRGPDAHIEMAL